MDHYRCFRCTTLEPIVCSSQTLSWYPMPMMPVPVPVGLQPTVATPTGWILILAAATQGHWDRLREHPAVMCFASPPVPTTDCREGTELAPLLLPAGQEVGIACTRQHRQLHHSGLHDQTMPAGCGALPEMPPQPAPPHPHRAGAPPPRSERTRCCATRPGAPVRPLAAYNAIPHCPFTGTVDLSPTTTARTAAAPPHEMTTDQQRGIYRPCSGAVARLSRAGVVNRQTEGYAANPRAAALRGTALDCQRLFT
jgi:hypothetical protein